MYILSVYITLIIYIIMKLYIARRKKLHIRNMKREHIIENLNSREGQPAYCYRKSKIIWWCHLNFDFPQRVRERELFTPTDFDRYAYGKPQISSFLSGSTTKANPFYFCGVPMWICICHGHPLNPNRIVVKNGISLFDTALVITNA